MTFAVESGPASIGGSLLTFSGPGSVSISASQAGDGNWNTAPSQTHSFIVSKAVATVTLGNMTQAYDGSARAASVTTVPAGLTVDVTYDGNAWAPTNAGSYSVQADINEAMYQGSVTGLLTVSQATNPAVVTLGDLAQTYDGSVRGVTATTEPAGLTVEFTYNGSLTTPTDAGTYAVTGTVQDVNYTGSASGTLAVSKALAIVTLGELAQTFDGSDRIATATTAPTGLVVNITYDGSAAAPTNSGTYAVTGTVNDVNYDGNAVNTLVVSKAVASVTLGSLSQTADGAPKSATATTVPAGLAVDFTYEGSSIGPSNAGSYAVTGTVNEVNYQGSTTGSLVISAAMTAFESWLDDQALDYQDIRYADDADDDGDGMTTYEEYLADTLPDNSNSVLVLTSAYVIASDAGESTGQIHLAFPASTNRFYQLEYCTDLRNETIGVTNIGWGVPEMVITNKSSGVWFGIIRSMLAEP